MEITHLQLIANWGYTPWNLRPQICRQDSCFDFRHWYLHNGWMDFYHSHLGVGIVKWLQLRTSSKLSDPLQSYVSQFINSFDQCWHVFLTVMHCKKRCQTHASTLVETCNKKESWWRERHSPKRSFISRTKMTAVLLVMSVDMQYADTSSPSNTVLNSRNTM